MTPFVVILMGSIAILLLIMGILIRTCLVVVTVTGSSMLPALAHGDRVVVLRRWPSRWVRRGSIVLVWPWPTSSAHAALFEVAPYIKRIVALGGETFCLSTEPALEGDQSSQHEGRRVWQIPSDHIFVLGDNRAVSLDSLAWGPIPLQSILGVVLLKWVRKDRSCSPPAYPPQEVPLVIGPPVGHDAPPFTAQTVSGEMVTCDAYKGQAVAFLFISPSYMCRRIIPVLTALFPKITEAGVKIVFVSSTGIKPTRLFVEELHIYEPVLIAPRASNPFLYDYVIPTTPAYCLINTQGKVQSAECLSVGCETQNLCEALSLL